MLYCHLKSVSFVSPHPLFHFRFDQTWSETKTLPILLKSFGVLSPTHTSFYLSCGGSLCLPSLPLRVCLPSLRSPPFSPHAPGSDPPHDLVIWTDGSFPFGKDGSGVLFGDFFYLRLLVQAIESCPTSGAP